MYLSLIVYKFNVALSGLKPRHPYTHLSKDCRRESLSFLSQLRDTTLIFSLTVLLHLPSHQLNKDIVIMSQLSAPAFVIACPFQF